MSKQRHVDRATLAELLGIGQRTITGFVADYPDFPTRLRSGRREFPLAKCLKWYIDHRLTIVEARQRRGKGPSDGPDTPAYRKALANAELAEMEVVRQLRTLVPIEDVHEVLRETCDHLEAVIRGIPSRHAESLLNITTKVEAIRRLKRIEDAIRADLRRPFENPDGEVAA